MLFDICREINVDIAKTSREATPTGQEDIIRDINDRNQLCDLI